MSSATNAQNDKASNTRPTVAGWSSPVARQAHNLKVTGSNPVPATKSNRHIKYLEPDLTSRVFACRKHINATSTFAKTGGDRRADSILTVHKQSRRSPNRPFDYRCSIFAGRVAAMLDEVSFRCDSHGDRYRRIATIAPSKSGGSRSFEHRAAFL